MDDDYEEKLVNSYTQDSNAELEAKFAEIQDQYNENPEGYAPIKTALVLAFCEQVAQIGYTMGVGEGYTLGVADALGADTSFMDALRS